MISRRSFLHSSVIGSVALLEAGRLTGAFAGQGPIPELYTFSAKLLRQWADAVLALQVTDKSDANYGGIWCPADKLVHGRCGDTIYPLMHLASVTHDQKYSQAAKLLYDWTERVVSQPDGSWLNENTPGSWKGTTVFYAIALGETLKHHGNLVEAAWKEQIIRRLDRAGEFVYANFSIQYGNINYPVTAAYGLCLLGELLGKPKFTEKGRSLAREALQYFTEKDTLLYGEGDLDHVKSAKGCHAIDLGYNVEESLPSLVQYALLTNDKEVMAVAMRSLQQHLRFMLPDGGWDNSWGTRNFKWTYWGSRTSDGCQTAYALIAGRDARFYKAALKNTQQMQSCTHNGLLTGGPHFAEQGVPVCVHHTFSHMKALANVLNHPVAAPAPGMRKTALPRENDNEIHFVADVQTWLLSRGKWRATVTGYDKDYKKTKNGHATGGALSMLWHEQAGTVLCASMNEYQLVEAGNMQKDNDPLSMPLTPRIEWKKDGNTYRNISDQSAVITVSEEKGSVTVVTKSRLVNRDQQHPSSGEVHCEIRYVIAADDILLSFAHDGNSEDISILLPLIARASETVDIASQNRLLVNKEKAIVQLTSDMPMRILPATGKRHFNFVPGLQAVAVALQGNKGVFRIQCKTKR